MEDIINAFGIDARLITIQIINFAILMVALVYFLYNPILNLLREREEKIILGIKDAEAAASAKAEAETEKKAVLTEAHQAAEAVHARAKTAADETAHGIVVSAEATAQQVLAEAAIKAEQLKVAALRAGEAEIAKTAILAAEKILRQQTS